jgi:fatty acid desaturase
MNKFKKDPNYLLYYCIQRIFIFCFLDLLLFSIKGFDLSFAPQRIEYFLPLFALLFCGLPSSVMHNCTHGNIHPRWLNDLIGKLCGTIMLYGFTGFSLTHMYHHIYPDDPTMDPHPPRGQFFLSFVISPVKGSLGVVERNYYKYFGDNDKTRRSIKIQLVLFNIGIALRILFWVLLLGAKFFILFYLPVYMANVFVFAHINFVAHTERADGSSEIINLNHNYYYKIVNFLSFGGYFHKSHHLKPGAFNPQKVKIDDSIEYITYTPPFKISKPEKVNGNLAVIFHRGL